jgi:outer membrane immunogenic protein
MFTWTGFYAGANVGYGVNAGDGAHSGVMSGDSTYDTFPGNVSPYSLNAHREGVIGGGQIGYNYQLWPTIVVGLEADFQGAGISNYSPGTVTGMPMNTAGDDGAMGAVSGKAALNWFGTVRGRLGWNGLDPRVMLYVTGGFAYGQVSNSATSSFNHFGCVGNAFPTACAVGAAYDNSTKVGWTFGGGLEWAPAALPNWSLKAEYLYVSLPGSNLNPAGLNFGPSDRGNVTTLVAANQRVENNFHIFRVGANYHFFNFGGFDPAVAVLPGASGLPSRKGPPEYAVPAFAWNGFYVGANVGYGIAAGDGGATGVMSGDSTYDSHPQNFTPYSLNAHREGVIGGGQIGYNYQVWPTVMIGLEADFQGADISRYSPGAVTGMLANTAADDGALGTISGKSALNWFGTVRGRLGWNGLDPRMLLFVTGGLAYGGVSNSATATFNHYGCVRGDTGPNVTACAAGAAYDNSTKVGWSFGGGLEWAPAALPNWSLKAEYLYISLPTSNMNAAGLNFGPSDRGVITTWVAANQRVENNFHILRVGANYHLNFGAAAPVLAKY